jgi:hypothetical protein
VVQVKRNYRLQAANEAHIEAATNDAGHFAEGFCRGVVSIFGTDKDIVAAALTWAERGKLVISAEAPLALVEKARGDKSKLGTLTL